MKILSKYLQTRPEIEKVFVDGKGGWCLNTSLLHPTELSRDEVFALAKNEPEQEEPVTVTEADIYNIQSILEENKDLKSKLEISTEAELEAKHKLEICEMEKQTLQTENESLLKTNADWADDYEKLEKDLKELKKKK